MLSGDADSLEQMLINLVVNAVEAASRPEEARKSGGRKAEARKRVDVSISCNDDRLVVEVSDTGEGPADAVQSTLFDPFVTAKPDGTGLGLSVARQIAQAHGGEIAWERSNATTRFLVDLSAARRALPRPAREMEATSA
jgi:signal transduction histidine kinase